MLKIANMTNASYFGRRSKPLLMIRILIARFFSPNLIARAMMKSTRRGGSLRIIGRMGSKDHRAPHIVMYVLRDLHI